MQRNIKRIHKLEYNVNFVHFWLSGLLILLLLMILIGGLTRLTDSGLSITNWEPIIGAIPPLSNSQWILAFDQYKLTNEFKIQNFDMDLLEFKVIYWWEWGHRQFGRLIGLFWFIGFTYLLAFSKLPKLLKFSFLTLGCLGLLQAIIGWWMVKSGLDKEAGLLDVASYRLAIHLNLALIITSLIFLLIKVNNNWIKNISFLTILKNFSKEEFFISIFIFSIFIQITLGALVSGIDAGKSYNEWPLMDDSFLPEDIFYLNPKYLNFFENPATVQFNHRMMGYFLFMFGILIWILDRLKKTPNTKIRQNYNLLLLLIIFQVIIGILAVVNAVPIYLGILHQLFAVLLLLVTLNLRFNLYLVRN